MTTLREMTVEAEGLAFPEGPVWTADESVLVSEVRGGTIVRISVGGGGREVVSTPGGGPVGSALGPDGHLYVCQNGGSEWVFRGWPSDSIRVTDALLPKLAAHPHGGSIQRIRLATGEVDTIYGLGNGAAVLERPNDIVFDHQGNFYFSDMGSVAEGPRGQGTVYHASRDGRSIEPVIGPLDLPNGVGLNPDGTILYVTETMEGTLWSIGVDGARVVRQPEVIGRAPKESEHGFGGFDSLAVDAEGSILIGSLGPGGISVFRPNGELVERLETPDPVTTNACFGGPDLTRLYVTMSSTGMVASFSRDVPGLAPLFEA